MKATISLAVFCLVNSADATFVQKHLVSIGEKERELNLVHEQMNFKHKSRLSMKGIPQMLTDGQLDKQAEHSRSFKKNPDSVFGSNDAWYYNTRDGGAPGSEINMHDDEPIVMGEVNMDDSSESGSDGEETPEDIESYKAAVKRADSHAQIRSSSHRHHKMSKKHQHHKNKKTHEYQGPGYLQFYDDNTVDQDYEENEFAQRVSLGSFDYSRLNAKKNQQLEQSFSKQLEQFQQLSEGMPTAMKLNGGEPLAVNPEDQKTDAQKQIESDVEVEKEKTEEATKKAVPENTKESTTRGPFGDSITEFDIYNTHTTNHPAGSPLDHPAPMALSQEIGQISFADGLHF